MLKLVNLKEKDYEKFLSNQKKSHFLQSFAWGEFSKQQKKLIPHYTGLINEKNEIKATALLLQKQLPFGYSYFYSPRGFVLDYSDLELLEVMSLKVIDYVKNQNGIFFKIDPDIIINNKNYLNENVDLEYPAVKIIETLKKIGFKIHNYDQDFHSSQPKFTFRLDLKQSSEELYNHFSKTTRQRIGKSKKLDTIVEIGNRDDISSFYDLMLLTENRKGFVSHSKNYYESLYDIFNSKKNSKALLFLGKIKFNNTIKTLKKSLSDIENQISKLSTENISKNSKIKYRQLCEQKEKTNLDIKKYEKAKKKYGKELILSAHMIIQYGDKSWVLYAGNHDKLSETYVNYNTYNQHLFYSKNEKLNYYDQFGTIGNISKNNPNYGIHEFKKKFGGNYIEFIGEYEYITNKIIYFVFKNLVPIYRNYNLRKSQKNLKKTIEKN